MPALDVYLGETRLERLELGPGTLRIGRSAADNDLSFEHLGVADLSARHLEIRVDLDRLHLVDLGSKNGTRLNGARVTGAAALVDGDEIGAGSVRLVVRAGAESALEWAVARLGALAAAPTATARLRVVVREARAATGADVAWALQWEGTAAAPRYRVLVHEGGAGDVPEPAAVPRSIVGRAVARGRAVWTEDATADTRFQNSVSVQALGVRGAGAVPLGSGALFLAQAGVGPSEAARARVEALCRVAAPLLEARSAPEPAGGEEVLPGVFARSAAMVELAEQVRTFATLGYRILLLGERGTGKSLIATAIHALSGARGELVLGDCPNLAPTIAESLLFGHEKGSFSGAVQRHVGWAERARDGTLFLDEVGELPPEVQPKLLALVEQGTFEPIGATRRQTFSGRLVAATNRDIDGPTSPFRRDLFDRLAQVVLRVPPLRERPEDVEPLSRRFFDGETARIRALGAAAPAELADEAVAVLRAMPLEGNVRALKSLLVRAIGRALVDRSDAVLPRHLDGLDGVTVSASGPTDYWDAVYAYERSLLERALAAQGGNQTRARQALGLSNGAWDRAKKRTGL